MSGEGAGSPREKRIGRGNDGGLGGVREEWPMGMGGGGWGGLVGVRFFWGGSLVSRPASDEGSCGVAWRLSVSRVVCWGRRVVW